MDDIGDYVGTTIGFLKRDTRSSHGLLEIPTLEFCFVLLFDSLKSKAEPYELQILIWGFPKIRGTL